MVYLKETRTAPSSAAGEGKAGRGSDGAGEEKKEEGRVGVGWGQIETKAGQTVGRTSPSPSSPASCFSSCEGELFKL